MVAMTTWSLMMKNSRCESVLMTWTLIELCTPCTPSALVAEYTEKCAASAVQCKFSRQDKRREEQPNNTVALANSITLMLCCTASGDACAMHPLASSRSASPPSGHNKNQHVQKQSTDSLIKRDNASVCLACTSAGA